MRRLPVVLLTAALAVAGVLVPISADAAEAPRLLVRRADPLMTEPLVLEVAAQDASGSGVRFSGTAVLAVGKTAVSVPMSAAADETAVVRLPTTSLPSGWSTLRLRATAAGRTVTSTLDHFAELAPSLSISGFGCAAVTAAGGTIRWAVDRMAGVPVRTPNSRDVPLLPYVRGSAARWSMTTEDGLPLSTSGAVVIRSAAGAVVARQALQKQVRRLVFGARWNGRAGGAFRAGAYTATLTLKDAAGRTVTAQQPVEAVTGGASPCGA